MEEVVVTLSWTSVFWPLYILGGSAMLVASAGLWMLPRRVRVIGLAVLALATASRARAAVARAVIAGRAPVIGTFENTLIVAGMIAAVALGSCLWGPFARRYDLARSLAPFGTLALALGQFAPRAPLPIDAAGRSIIGYAHAFVGWLDFALLLAATVAAAGFLIARASEDAPLWEEAQSRLIGAGFALLTFTIASGSLYSFILFGSWNRWQVVETAAAGAWLAYAAVLHSRVLQRWRGVRQAVATVIAFSTALVAFWIWAVYPYTYHYFDVLLRVR